MAALQLQQLFCARFGCSEAEYEELAFRHCLYWHARVMAPVLRLLSPSLFDSDLEFIGDLGSATDWQEVKIDVNNFHIMNKGESGFWRATLRLRVSGRKATRLARQLFSEGPGEREPNHDRSDMNPGVGQDAA